jgi:hypothetical protein
LFYRGFDDFSDAMYIPLDGAADFGMHRSFPL